MGKRHLDAVIVLVTVKLESQGQHTFKNTENDSAGAAVLLGTKQRSTQVPKLNGY
jgi:hypothetical protein